MKNTFICILIVVILFGGVGGYFVFKNIREEKRLEEIKKGWYVEITNDYINVRDDAHANANQLGTVNKGEIYEVLDMNFDNTAYYWYKIDFNGKEAWIASKRRSPYVKDYNNPTDIAVPIIKFHDEVYKVVSIDDINYKHLEVIEDREGYEITHKIYHEYKPYEYIDQYWILYTITDAVGKSSSKMQKIEFEVKPSEDQVLDFADYSRD